ncbi:hypothetical protein BDR26DRAFT_912418 [Obelidium mucronatum]|nr:hypothetical protein BDR26DRAFT_912418 [Obelidium mucronatum]
MQADTCKPDLVKPTLTLNEPSKMHSNIEKSECQSDDDYFSATELDQELPIPASLNKTNSLMSIGSILALASSSFWSNACKKSKHSTTATPHLPVEIILHLNSYIGESQRSELYSLLGINKTWNQATAAKYWKNIHIKSSTKWRQFEDICLNLPLSQARMHEYANLVHTLHLSNMSDPVSSTSWTHVIESFSNLKVLILDSVSVSPFGVSDLSSPITPLTFSSLPNSPSIQRRGLSPRKSVPAGIRRGSHSMPTTPRIRRAATTTQNPAQIIELQLDQEMGLPNLEALKITWSPDLHVDTLLATVFHARNLTSLSLAGIHTLLEADLCKVLQYVPDLKELKLGDLRSTRAAFSSSRGLGTFHGSLLATELAKWNKKLTSLELFGLVNLNAAALAGLLIVLTPLSISESEGGEEPAVLGQTESVPENLNDLNEESPNDEVPSRSTRLTHIGLHSSTSHIEDSVLHATLTSPLAVSNITHFAISEAHTLTDASFIDIMRAMSETLKVLEVGPGLNINEVAISSIGHFCTGLQSLTCIGLAKSSDVGHFVGHKFEFLESLTLKDMKGLKEVRDLVIASRKMSMWRQLVEMMTEEDDNLDETFVDAVEQAEDIDQQGLNENHGQGQDMAVQANPENILAETMAAQFGLPIANPDEAVLIGCVKLSQLRLVNCPQLKGKSIIQIVTAMNRTLSKAIVSFSMMDPQSRLVRVFFPGA